MSKPVPTFLMAQPLPVYPAPLRKKRFAALLWQPWLASIFKLRVYGKLISVGRQDSIKACYQRFFSSVGQHAHVETTLKRRKAWTFARKIFEVMGQKRRWTICCVAFTQPLISKLVFKTPIVKAMRSHKGDQPQRSYRLVSLSRQETSSTIYLSK